jgi:hypothetical protein
MTLQPRRKRGVILTPQGKQKLLEAIREFERDHNFGEKYTIEELSDRTGLDLSRSALFVTDPALFVV